MDMQYVQKTQMVMEYQTQRLYIRYFVVVITVLEIVHVEILHVHFRSLCAGPVRGLLLGRVKRRLCLAHIGTRTGEPTVLCPSASHIQ